MGRHSLLQSARQSAKAVASSLIMSHTDAKLSQFLSNHYMYNTHQSQWIKGSMKCMLSSIIPAGSLLWSYHHIFGRLMLWTDAEHSTHDILQQWVPQRVYWVACTSQQNRDSDIEAFCLSWPNIDQLLSLCPPSVMIMKRKEYSY